MRKHPSPDNNGVEKFLGEETDPTQGITVIIPCLNEAESIRHVVRAAREGIGKTGLPGEVIVVDNGSTDGSPEAATEAGARVVPEAERGYGAALRRGFASAGHSIIVMADGDATYDLSKLEPFVEPLLANEADFVVGNRMYDIREGAMPFHHRYVGNPVLSLMLRIMFRTNRVRDAHCGMRAITKKGYESLDCVTTGMEFASEMIVRAIHRGLRLREVNITYHPRVGESKLRSLKDGWRHIRFMLLHSPTWALLVPGALVWLVGITLSLLPAFTEISINRRVLNIHTMIIGGLLSIISIQFLTIGLLAKAYAHFSGLRSDRLIIWFYGNFTFERLILYTLPLALTGLVITLGVIILWVRGGFGSLNEAKLLFVGALCLVNSSQLWSAGYLFGILALPRKVGFFGEGGSNR